MGKLERDFQAKLINELHEMFPDAIILKNDSNYCQGIPDVSIFCGPHWAMLECKKSSDEPYRPNQKYYIDKADSMSFCRTIYPENKEEVLHDLQRSFKA